MRESGAAVVSLYARGRDYHRTLRQRLQALASRIEGEVGAFGYRVATDSAPVMEVELARKAGLGWRGKHTLLLSQDAGSTFFLGEILTDLPLPVDAPATERCGTCARCIDVCPTQAITGPYQLDARRCISYLTIELPGSIPEELRPLIGNRVYGCDDCQLACPWNKFAQTRDAAGLRRAARARPRDAGRTLRAGPKQEFDERHAGSAIRRIGHARWLRNIAVALGNARVVAGGHRSAAGARRSSGPGRARARRLGARPPRRALIRAARRSPTAAASPSPPASGT